MLQPSYPHRFLCSYEPAFVKQRKADLDAYLQQLQKWSHIRETDEFCSFLQLHEHVE